MRVASAVVLAPLALAASRIGGWPFVLFWTSRPRSSCWEWTSIVDRRPHARAGVAVVALALPARLRARPRLGIAALLAVGAVAVVGARARAARPGAAPACSMPACCVLAPVLLRATRDYGFTAMLFLFAVVWATDIVAYFVGRAVGGPKLWPRVSPKKTWSGAIGGVAGAVAAGVAVALCAGVSSIAGCGVVALLLSIVSQAGDLFESAIKRRFGAKDASHSSRATAA